MANVRLAKPEDIPLMMAIAERSDAAAHWSESRYREIFTSTSPRRMTWIVEDPSGSESAPGEAKVVHGFLVARHSAKDWEIENIVVSPDAQRMGHGSRLLSEFMGVARNEGSESIFLEVRDSNSAARAFYLRHGFKDTGRRKMYYRAPEEDAILYQIRFA